MNEDGEQGHDRERHGARAEQQAASEGGLFAEVADAVGHDGGHNTETVIHVNRNGKIAGAAPPLGRY